MRLDQAIAARYPDISRRKAKELLSAHRVLVNERVVSVSSREVSDTDRIAILEADPDIEVLRTGRDWVAVNKPAGLPTQPDRERTRRSLEELLRAQLKQTKGSAELYLLHRLDTGTSGVVVFATTREAAARLSKAFADRSVRKTYLALVDGDLAQDLTLDAPIDGKEARTTIRMIRRDNGRTLVEAEIHSGRTHQIRIHLSGAGHAVVGDRRYGSGGAVRLMLHAWKLDERTLGEIVAPPPPELSPES